MSRNRGTSRPTRLTDPMGSYGRPQSRVSSGSASSSRTRWLHHGQRCSLADLGADRSVGRWWYALACLGLRDLGLLARDRRLASVRPLACRPAPADLRGRHPARNEAIARELVSTASLRPALVHWSAHMALLRRERSGRGFADGLHSERMRPDSRTAIASNSSRRCAGRTTSRAFGPMSVRDR